jgi:hypothetical protein
MVGGKVHQPRDCDGREDDEKWHLIQKGKKGGVVGEMRKEWIVW